MSRKILTDKRNTDIYQDYLKEWNLGLRSEIICENLGTKYYMTAQTILVIVTKQARKAKQAESGKEVP